MSLILVVLNDCVARDVALVADQCHLSCAKTLSYHDTFETKDSRGDC